MKRKLCFLALLLTVTALPAFAETITLNVTSPVQVGSSFNVLVQVNDVFGGRSPGDLVEAYGFNVVIGDSSIFKYSGETAGSLFDDFSGFPGGPMVSGFASNPAGIGPSNFSGPLTLATLRFSALAPGTTSISVTWDNTDPNQGLVYASLPYGPISAAATVRSVALTVPEPGTWMLLGTALALLWSVSPRNARSL